MVKGKKRDTDLSPRARKLVAMRTDLRLSQQAVSHLLGVSLQTVWRWENDEFEFDDEVFRLLPSLAQNTPLKWCDTGRSIAHDTKTLAEHIRGGHGSRGCPQCSDVVYFLTRK